MAKRAIRLFGFPIHDAPGEAEAECALLQQQGIVDAVLSEDVDTIMFGCTRTIRNWTAEGPRGAKTPTHVSLYDVDELVSAGTGLDREGMVLVALMSGGDYIPEGVPGCGVKLACEAAKAGFGKALCRLKSDDDVQFEEWRTNLRHELRTNESGFFRVRHKALSIPDEFPSRQVLRHYTHPVVSNATTVDKLKTEVNWSRPMDVQGLRYFVEETFDWVNKAGAVKLTRVLSPSLLVSKLLARHMSNRPSSQTTEEMEQDESNLVQRITGRRNHHSTDGIPELRVAHIPADIVGLDLSQELEEVVSFGRQGLALNSDDEFEAAVDGDAETAEGKTRAKSTFDPTIAELIWLPESLVKLSAPLTVEDWEEKQRSKSLSRASRKTAKTTKINNKKTTRAASNEAGALDKWPQPTETFICLHLRLVTTADSVAEFSKSK
ncbi:DNA repair protein complementing XP-G cells [Colletotrichum liriopes]|uniref:DNA repair protein complementing XP-G cells n=1 Tax=Colletotrichum liriopes TaxID=708192 RepID=A0AA37GLK3_9PEZI|nr:DNA repair protein complementing XP-G cells [Colletotrichum liriopes]